MTLAAELFGAFVGGIASVVVSVALFGPRFVRWYMKRKLGGMMKVTTLTTNVEPSTGVTFYSTAPTSSTGTVPPAPPTLP